MSPRPFGPAIVLPLLALLPAGVAAQGTAAQDETPAPEQYGLRLEYREYRPTATGKVKKGAGGEEGTLIDIVDDLGIKDKRTFEARATLKIKTGHKLRASYTPLDYDGDQAAPRNFTFKNTTYFRTDRVVTSMKGALYSGDYQWEFYQGPRGFVGALIGARMFDVDTILVDLDQGVREQDSTRVPIPVLGIAGRGYAGKLSLEGEFSGLSVGSFGSFYEFETSGRLHLSDRLAVQVGYRLLSLNGKDDPDLIEFRMGGWQFGLELSL
jgi:hypothetical protein